MSIQLKRSTSEGRRVIKIYSNLMGTSLSDLYKRPSQYTIDVYNKLYGYFSNDVDNNNGHSWRVTQKAGSWSWSCGWQFEIDGHKYIRVETRENSYIVDMEAQKNMGCWLTLKTSREDIK